jgi:DNA-binding NarL/FixJ family response regulator
VVADDHAVVRKGIVQILQDGGDFSVQGEAATGTELLELLGSQGWDAAILDLSMPGISGLDLLKQVRALQPNMPVLILSVHPEDQYAVRMLRAGASGYLTKESAPNDLVAAVRKICAGGRYVSEALAEQLAFELDADTERPPHERLSDREYQVLRLLSEGLTPTAISEQLCLSVKTVSTYRTRLLEKMGMKNNAELMKYAIKAGLTQ